MPLIDCPECKNECSNQAVFCVKCGHPFVQVKTNVKETHNSENIPPEIAIGSVLRGILWLFFAISVLYSFGVISIVNDMPRPVYGYNDSRILSDKIAIGYHIAPVILMIIILAITYSARGRK